MAAPLTMHFDVSGDLLAGARDCEAEVFLRWYGNSREQLAEEYGPYEDSSAFLCIADEHGDVLAAARLVAPGGASGLKTLTDVGREPWNVDGARSARAAGAELETLWDVATIGVRRQSADTARLSLALYHGIVNVCRANGMSGFVAVLDERVRRLLDSVGIVSRTLPGASAAPYLGSPSSTPVYVLRNYMFDQQRREFPDAYRLVTLGHGLDGIAVPGLDHFRYDRFTDADLARWQTGELADLPIMA
ncbi:hypothetical protein N866_10615 [Actinotalea ferrariae CF5-4]|uniref:GNAT family N-acetyltransferase n=1 Tax=Actinotalea ferrariae CF5-4 TaxID=948458 RepID=A0A021VWT6_9CELL|nr:hypothetical protein [Actinotalea ferrariae]EYR64475.1 hypothetical protein N866_10615 [Actinotalea ferrariae CF5-4]